MIKDNALRDLTDVLEMTVPGEDVKVKDKILPGFLDDLADQPLRRRQNLSCMPMFYGPCGLFYNAGLFEEKGWSVPTTWDEMWELGDKAKAEGIACSPIPPPATSTLSSTP
ncbi:MAG: extracellular solute-binding protein [Ruthenibacterium lactatiformans]